MDVICGACGRNVEALADMTMELAAAPTGGFRCKCGMTYRVQFTAVETPLRAARRAFPVGARVEPRDGLEWNDIFPLRPYVSIAATVRVVEVTGWRDSEDDPVVLLCAALYDGPVAAWVNPSKIQRKEGE